MYAPALRRFWTSITFFLLSFGVGVSWDRAWHAAHPFEDFFSPPHLFIYLNFAFAGVALWWTAQYMGSAVAFGAPLPALSHRSRLPRLLSQLPRRLICVPRGLLLVCSAFGVVGLAGFCDMIWHTRFGLDETGWSFPHAMLGWGIMLALWGFYGARLAVPAVPHWLLRLVVGAVLLSVTVNTIAGPLGRNPTIENIQRVAALAVLASDPAPQHTFRMYETWNVTRGHLLFVPVVAFGTGLAVAFLLRLERRVSIVVLAAILGTLMPISGELRTARFLGLAADVRTWLPAPLFVVPLAWLALRRLHLPESAVWAAAGALHGALVVAVWRQPRVMVIGAALLMPLGAALGSWIGARLVKPDHRVLAIAAGLGIGVPAVLGMLDLWLRRVTP